MATTIQVLNINPGESDGDGRKWPKHTYVRNDNYFKERIATDKWIHDLPGGAQPNVTYRLNKLPNGYAGFEKARADTKHVDRYIYGHPNGQFRSLNEFYPHFKHLMDFGGPVGCDCKQCMGLGRGNGTKKKPTGAVTRKKTKQPTPPQRSKYFAPSASAPATDSEAPRPPGLISPYVAKSTGRIGKDGRLHSDSPERPKREMLDKEGTPDVYELLLKKVKEGDHEKNIDISIKEIVSPDWRASHVQVRKLLEDWKTLAKYIPRVGELVLFARNINTSKKTLTWNKATRAFRCADLDNPQWYEYPKWEVGVVTQMPVFVPEERDLFFDNNKEEGVNYSGFRIEPLSAPGSQHKPYTKQYKHVPLHAIRPFAFWRECLNGKPEAEWHPTIAHALTVSSSVCVIGRHRFRAAWPNATVFARGVYIGAELIMLGDSVRLVQRRGEQSEDEVTEIMIVTAIRLRFVNLDAEDDDTTPEHALPHQTSLHISGKVYTRNPMRSFDGVGKIPITEDSSELPEGLAEYGPWYHYTDPAKPTARIEVPYTRVLGRCFEYAALTPWFNTRAVSDGSSTSNMVGKMPVKDTEMSISLGLPGVIESRQRSRMNDSRIRREEGKTWFWADTRAEQLDLHEVNGRHVSTTDRNRTVEEVKKLRTVIKAIDGKKGAYEEYQAARKVDSKQNAAGPSTSAYGMVAASRQIDTEDTSAQESESVEEVDPMDVDEAAAEQQHSSEVMEEETWEDAVSVQKIPIRKVIETVVLSDSEDEDEVNTNQLASELAKSIRPNDARLR